MFNGRGRRAHSRRQDCSIGAESVPNFSGRAALAQRNMHKCTLEAMCAIMSEEKKGELDKVTLTSDKLRKYFPKSYTPQKMEETILKLLETWHKKRTQQQER